MNEHLSNFSHIDPDDQVFNGLFPGIGENSMCNYYSLEKFNLITIDPLFNLSLFNFNIRSFAANGTTFEALLHSFSIRPKFIVLTETWNSPTTYELCHLESFTAIHTYRDNMRGGGVSIFCDDGFRLEKMEDLSLCNATIETCVGRVFFGDEYLVICGVYRPHTDSIENFTSVLEGLLNTDIVRRASFVLLTGDMNINLANIESSYVDIMFLF